MAVEKEVLYRERQRFTQRWLWVVILGVAGIFWLGVIYQVWFGGRLVHNPVTDVQLVLAWLLVGIGLPFFFYSMSLVTEVVPGELQVRFFPFHLRPVRIPLHLVRNFEKVTYNPISDYGGWGIRWGFKGKAYNVSGNEGVLLYFYNRKPLLVGSQRPKELLEAIKAAKEIRSPE